MASAVVTIQPCTVAGYLLLSQPALCVCMHVHRQGGLCMCLVVYLPVPVLRFAIFHVHEYTSLLCFECLSVCCRHPDRAIVFVSSQMLVFCEMSF